MPGPPSTMRAAVWHGPGAENFRPERWPRPSCGPDDVLLRVRCCFFSAMYARAVLVGHPRLTAPVVLGRMLAGDVVAVGARVVDGPRPGQRVTVNPERPCEACFPCLRGVSGHCLAPTGLDPGGFAEFVRVPAPLLPGIFPLPDWLPYHHAAFAETLACVLQGLDHAAVRRGDTVVVLGSGGVGLSFLQLARRQGAARIVAGVRTARDPVPLHRLGAHRVAVQGPELAAAVASETEGHGADVVIEASGSPDAYRQLPELLRPGGTGVAFGGMPPGTRVTTDPNALHYRSLRLVGSYRYRPEHFRRAVELIAAGRLDLTPVVTHRLDWDRLTTDAVALQRDPDCRALVVELP
ncbi:zinc-dependent alcohol dehydrogenase [Streptomyces sp. JNUCC 64]